ILLAALEEKELILRILAVEAIPPGEIEFAVIAPTIKEAAKSKEWNVNTRAFRVVKNWGPAAVSVRKTLVERYSVQGLGARKELLQAIFSMNVKDEAHLLSLVYGLRDFDLSVICAWELDRIGEGGWSEEWIGKRARFLKELERSRPDLIPIWYLEKERKKSLPETEK
ncbi:MAG: hypothetical protein P1V97_22810, partial [Planctomycetota bacterium]|nr:hypothetical protein [Planctomycetota bacterium]